MCSAVSLVTFWKDTEMQLYLSGFWIVWQEMLCLVDWVCSVNTSYVLGIVSKNAIWVMLMVWWEMAPFGGKYLVIVPKKIRCVYPFCACYKCLVCLTASKFHSKFETANEKALIHSLTRHISYDSQNIITQQLQKLSQLISIYQ